MKRILRQTITSVVPYVMNNITDYLQSSLAALVRMILCDSNTKQIIYDLEISPAATLQLLVFNAIKRSRADSVAVKHNLNREISSIASRPAHPQQNTQTGSH